MVSRKLSQLVPTAMLALGVLAGPVWGEVWEQTTWGDTIYYRADFSADAAGTAVLQVAAADRYVAYLNGVEVGADSLWNRMQPYDVEVNRATNRLAVRVVNEGRGSGSGVLALLEGDSLRAETTTNAGITSWYWTSTAQEGTGWTTTRLPGGDDWHRVQAGALEKGRVQGLVDTTLEVVAGHPGGIEVGRVGGSLVLGTMDGVNLALGRPTNRLEVNDGNLLSSWDLPTNAVNYFAAVDLQTRRRVNRVRVLTRGPNPAQFEANSLRGYSVQVSEDDITWSEVAEVRGIVQYAWSEARFASVFARHVRVVIVELDPAASPRVAEVEVYGTGHRSEGVYTSQVIDPAPEGGAVNLGRVAWGAMVPEGTALSVQLRGGRRLQDFDDPQVGWSAPLEDDGVWFPGAEPVELIQYRVHMSSHDGKAAPVFEGLQLEYSTDTAVSGAQTWVWPTRVPMGVDTTFICFLDLAYGAGDGGIERLEVEVPGQARLEESAPVADLLASWHSSSRLLTLVFAEPLTGVQDLQIPVYTKTHASLHAFRVYLYSPGSDNPLNAAENRELDPESGQRRSWSVSASTSTRRVLSEVSARPGVLTPNGDGINDHTVIEFVLSKLDVPKRVHIRLHDLSGRTVRQLPTTELTAGEYAAAPGGSQVGEPGYWDGRDDAGRRVPPGLYLYQVEVDLDSGAEVLRGVVSVAY